MASRRVAAKAAQRVRECLASGLASRTSSACHEGSKAGKAAQGQAQANAQTLLGQSPRPRDSLPASARLISASISSAAAPELPWGGAKLPALATGPGLTQLRTRFVVREYSAAAAALPAHQQIAMPSLSPTMTQGNIAKWVKAVGDQVNSGDVLCEIETDKATLAMESMEDGFLAKILMPEGSKDVPVGVPIAVMVDSEEDVPSFADYSPEGASSSAPPPPAAPAAPAAAPTDLPPYQAVAMPSLSPTMTQGNIAKWRKAVGDQVATGDVLCEIETDKATLEMESMEEGYIAKILQAEGSKDVPVGMTIAVLVDDESFIPKFADFAPGGVTPAAAQPAAPAAAQSAPPPPADLPKYQTLAMPSLSPTMTQGNIGKWRKSVGDQVASGDVMCEIETDKATLEMESMEEGYIAKILQGEGSKDVPVGTPIAILVDDEADIPKFASFVPGAAAPPPPPAAAPQAQAPTPSPSSQPVTGAAAAAPAPPRAASPSGKVLASPAAKKLALDSKVDISQVSGTGPGGRVIKADVEDYLKAPPPPKATPAAAAAAAAPVAAPAAAPAISTSEVRQQVAARMVQSVQSIPHYYLAVDAKVDNIQEALEKLNALASKAKGSTPITLEHVIIKAAAVASKKVPDCNSSWAGDFINQYDQVDISLSVFTDYGLVNPVIKGVDSKGLAAIAAEVERLKQAALDNKLTAADTQGGTFSVSNVAEYGLLSCSSIINPPQACILTVGAPQARVVPGSAPAEFGVETVVTATLSCDHRVVDGAVGAEWIGAFKAGLEDPLALLL